MLAAVREGVGKPLSLWVGRGAQRSLLSIVGRCRRSWVVWSAIVSVGGVVVGRCGRWWWAVIGVGGGPSLASIGGGGGSSPPVMSPGVAASNRVMPLLCLRHLSWQCGCHFLSS